MAGVSVFVDSEGTTYSVNNGLNLNMIYHPGYCFNNGTSCPDYISAEITSKETFKYGVYEGRMKFATGNGSWPAFWLYGNTGADDPQFNNVYASEIDIAEYNWHRKTLGGYTVNTDHVFHWWWPESIHGTKQMDIFDGIKNNSVNWSVSHTFKLIYTPYDVKFYIDGALNWRKSKFWTLVNRTPIDIFYEDINGSTLYSINEWFPKHEGQIILSQQVSDNVNNGDISAPQTSLFEWVTFKQFFLAPEITVPSLVCSTGTVTLDVDPLATNITWQLTPASLFTTSSGSGKTANIVRATGANGLGKITYTFQMPSGETFTAQKDVWVGAPVIASISGPTSTPNNTQLTYSAILESNLSAPTDYKWTLNPLNGNYLYEQGTSAGVSFHTPGRFELGIQAKNACSGSGYGPIYSIAIYVMGTYGLAISPNPATNEATIKLVGENRDVPVALTEWDYEIYDSMQGLKEKKSKLKTTETKISTSNWKDGVYFVRAIVGDTILSEKLLIKH